MKQENNQSGFSMVLSIIAVVLIVGVLSFIGWKLYNQPTKQVSDAVSNNANASGQLSKTSTAAVAINSQSTYLVIKEWGVAMPLSGRIKDAYYTVKGSNTGADGMPNTAWLGLTSHNAGGCNVENAGPSSLAKPMGSIIRVLPTDADPVQGVSYAKLYPNGATVGSYYYVYVPWQSKTCDNPAALKSIDAAFATAAKGIVSSTSTK